MYAQFLIRKLKFSSFPTNSQLTKPEMICLLFTTTNINDLYFNTPCSYLYGKLGGMATKKTILRSIAK